MVYPALNQWAGTPVLRSLGVVEVWLAGDILKNLISRLFPCDLTAIKCGHFLLVRFFCWFLPIVFIIGFQNFFT